MSGKKKVKTPPIPLSEDQRKFHPGWTAQDCINELQRIAKLDQTKVITRNYFRVHSQISESTWNRYFGTFHEFKRQAGVVLTRHAHNLERSIAKHASMDVKREMNAAKIAYEGKYLRPHKGRFQSVVVASDLHDVNCDPFYRRCLIDTVKRVKPEIIVLNGDLFDLPEFSKYIQDPRSYNPVLRIKWVHKFLEDLRNAAPNAEIKMVEGNHEYRLLRHLSEATPALMTVLADLHGMTVSSLLGLDKFEINLIARSDLAALNERDIKDEVRKNYVLIHDCLLFHHFPEGAYMGYPGANGHHHKHLVKSYYSPTFGPYEWHQTGAGHLREASYCAAEKWSTGFLVVHVDTHTKHSVMEYIDVRDFAVIGGLFYQRNELESVYPKK